MNFNSWHRSPLRRTRLNKTLLIVLLLIGSAITSHADTWPTTEFEVIPGPPVARNWSEGELSDYLDLVLPFFGDEFAFAGEMEIALSRIAKRYAALGFTAPMLEPLVTRDDGKLAYRVFVCETSWVKKLPAGTFGKSALQKLLSAWESCGAVAAHISNCSNDDDFRNYLYFNREQMLSEPTLSFWDYETMAHELMHAVQAGSALGKSEDTCSTGGWIMEAMADAIAVDLVEEFWPTVPEIPKRDQLKRYGIRNFSETLPTRKPRYIYQTSSFWRHIAEWYHAEISKAGRRSGSFQSDTNYGYLTHLLKQPLQGAPGPERELRWIDEGLKSTRRLTTNLARVYAEFIASMADQLRTRIAPSCINPPKDASKNSQSNIPPGCQRPVQESIDKARLDNYLRVLFGPASNDANSGSAGNSCRNIELSPENSVASEQFVLAAVASDCFVLTVRSAYGPSQPEQVVVTMSTGPKPRKDVTPLWVGKSGGMEVSQFMVFTSEDRDEAPGYGTVQFRVTMGEPTLFTLSNVAHFAQNSRLLSPIVTFTIKGWQSSLTRVPPPRRAPVRSKAGERPNDARGRHEAEIDRAFEEGLGQLTSNGLGSTDLRRNFGEFGGCEGDKKRYNLCGPQLEIELELTSAAEASVATSTSGGFFNQMRAGGVGRFAEMSLPELMALQEADEEMSPEFIEGGRIRIDIPRIDYGFTGAFDHALITVSKEGGGVYAATSSNPVSVNMGGLGGPSLRHIPIGKVTIEEYTPFVLRGTFEASLVERRNDRPYEPDEVIPVANRISGSFNIANPFEADPEYSADEAAARQQMGLDVLDNVIMPEDDEDEPYDGLSPDDVRELCQAGFDDDMLEGMGIEGGCRQTGGQSAQDTQPCACDCEEFNGARRNECEPQCETRYLQCDSGGDARREELIQILSASGLPPAMQEQYILEFDSMSLEEREDLIELLKLISETVNQ